MAAALRARLRRSLRLAAGVLLLIVVVAVVATGGYAATEAARGPAPATHTTTPPLPDAASAALRRPVASTSSPAPTGTEQAASVAQLLSAGDLRAEVLDVASGRVLFAHDQDAPGAPASTAKLLVATAALDVFGGTHRFDTRVLAGPDDVVTLVGGGDPTLSCAASGAAPAYAGAARISDLAAVLRRAGIRPSRIVVDDGLFAGPTVSPLWAPGDVPSSYGAPITALMCDGGRAAPTDVIRSANPDLAAGRALATQAGASDAPVVRGTAAAGERTVATVSSAPLSSLVTEMLHLSDNVIAEVLGRQVALEQGLPPTFTGAAAALRQVVGRLGVDPGTGMHDASGLAASDRLTVSTLAKVLEVVARHRSSVADMMASLPVAGWSGTLADRYDSGNDAFAAGLVRAKTGTLTAVATLAGLVHDASGRLLAFAVFAEPSGPTAAGEAQLDAAITALAQCGCGD